MNTAVNTEDISYKFIKDNLDKIETPFEDDFWEREILADRLTDYVSRITVGATIAIDAEWGAGKSWFVNNWKAKLEQEEFKVIYLNAFNQDYIDDPFLIISMEIANCLKSSESEFKAVKEKIGEAYRAILPNLPILLWYLTTSLAGMGAIAKPIADIVVSLQDSDALGKEAGKLLNERLQEHLSEQVENYDKEKQSLEYFKRTLGELTSNLDKPLVFIVDELDRCKPEFAIRLIERIKHFFDIPNVVFVLAVNKKQLEESINSFYGFTSASNYLEKFIDITVLLKSGTSMELKYENIIKTYIEKLGIEGIMQNDIKQLQTLCNVYKPNSRQMIRIFNKFSLLNNNFKSHQLLFLFLILIYTELKIISSLNEKELAKHFLTIHENHYAEGLKNFKARMGPDPVNTTATFLSNYIYETYGLNEFMSYLNFRFFPNSNTGYESSKNHYYPSKPSQSDLVTIWNDYIHLVG